MKTNNFIEILAEAAIDLDEKVVVQLRNYLDEMLRWNKKINLTSITDYPEAIEKHIVDSLYLLKYITPNSSILDMGSGAGLPGIPIAICRSDITVTSVDSVGKKINFQKHIKRLFQLDNFSAVAARIEDLTKTITEHKPDIVTARAFTSIGNLVEYAAPLLNSGSVLLAMKGAEGEYEIAENIHIIKKYGFECASIDKYKLPISLAERKIISLVKKID